MIREQHQQLARQSTLCRAQGISLYIIVVLNLQRYSVFAPKIGDFERKIGANDMRKLLSYNNFRVSVFFRKKFSCAEDCAEGIISCICLLHYANYIS